MPRFSLRDLFWLTLVVAMALASANGGRCAENEPMWFFTHNRPVGNRKPLAKPWEEVVGRQVVGEGLAWGSGKGLGEDYVILDRAVVYVAKGDFLKAEAHGRSIRVRGKLTNRTIKAALPGAVGPARDITIFEIVDAKWEFIDRVEWPWLTDTE